jgi:HAE1 family hydrophobic/amphiphilic exporter-1
MCFIFKTTCKFNKGYGKAENGYASLIGRIASFKPVTLILFAVFGMAAWITGKALPAGFIPTEDQGMIYVNVTTPPGSTVERTEKVLIQIEQILEGIDAVENVSTLAGYSLMSEISGASYGMAMINLKPWEERKESVDELITMLEEKSKGITEATIEFFSPPTVPGFGNAAGFELRLLDRTMLDDLQETARVSDAFLNALRNRKEISSAATSFDPSFPQYMIKMDQEMAAKKGVDIENAMNTLQALIGSTYATNFIRFGQMYKVMVQASPEYRAHPEDVLKLHVKNNAGEMVPFSAFIAMHPIFGPEQITRYNR